MLLWQPLFPIFWSQCIKPTLRLGERIFICEECGNVLDRDLNAAVNIRNVAVSFIDTQNACGEDGAGYLATESETVFVEAGTKQQIGMS
ncbi:MAG TPA: zinc ribbon domain-containing protein [Ktedonobacteraceae bacterium]|nr:zinc ribbon domain-containing protein [Ktedonobacteraceae bacterium]